MPLGERAFKDAKRKSEASRLAFSMAHCKRLRLTVNPESPIQVPDHRDKHASRNQNTE
jgi:hypothetical protein